jgi:hypothetical protein
LKVKAQQSNLKEAIYMKKLLPILFIAVLALVAVPAHADTTTCPTGALTAYLVGGFTCSTGTLTFSNFSFAPGGSMPTAASVGVTPITTGVDGFSFNPSLSVNNSGLGPAFIAQESDLTIFYTVTGSSITDLELGFNGAYSGTGSAEVTEQYCLGFASISGCSSGHPAGTIQVTNPPANYSQSVTFAPVSVLAVSKDIEVQTGSSSGTAGQASISVVSNQYSVPESASLTLLGLGLLGLAVAKRSKLGQLSL